VLFVVDRAPLTVEIAMTHIAAKNVSDARNVC
jgi:hypothetical protein